MGDRQAALEAVSDALLGIAGDLRSDAVLERLVEAARELAGARYAAGETMPVVKDSLDYLKAGPFCSTCGVRNDADAKFCDSCGATLS